MVPSAIFPGNGENIHDAVVERLARGVGVHLLRIIRTRTDDVVCVVAGADDDFVDFFEVYIAGVQGSADIN